MSRTIENARKIRETFVDRESKSVSRLKWDWPRSMWKVGSCEAIMYTSDKWKTPGDFQDYKHVAEAPQVVLVREGFIEPYPGQDFQLHGRKVSLTKMPDAFAVLAKALGLQVRLYDSRGKLGEFVQIDCEGLHLGGGKTSDGKTFVFVYSSRGPEAIIFGDELSIEKDGITG